jgi:hypothetical protein
MQVAEWHAKIQYTQTKSFHLISQGNSETLKFLV